VSEKPNQIRVTVANYVRAESDNMFRAIINSYGLKIGAFTHVRKPINPEKQPVVHMN